QEKSENQMPSRKAAPIPHICSLAESPALYLIGSNGWNGQIFPPIEKSDHRNWQGDIRFKRGSAGAVGVTGRSNGFSMECNCRTASEYRQWHTEPFRFVRVALPLCRAQC